MAEDQVCLHLVVSALESLEPHSSLSVSTSAFLAVRRIKQTLLHKSHFFYLVVAGGLWVYQTEQHHKEHLDHLRAENDGKLPETPNYEYLNRRVKPFPWGINSLFFNPAVRNSSLYLL